MIYLDHNATSPLHPAAREAMEPWLDVPCNTSSIHRYGRRAAAALERAAADVAALVGARPEQVIFTASATEANHHWFTAMRALGRTDRVLIGATEHPSLRRAAGPGIGLLPVDHLGVHVEPPSDIGGLSVMAANHETGVISPLHRLRMGPGWRHVDATAAAGRLPLDLRWADGITLSSHKIGGPMGVGALIAKNMELPSLFAGPQQRGRRGGTPNLPAIVGFGAAARVALAEMEARRERWERCASRLLEVVHDLGGERIGAPCVPSVVNVCFPGLPAEIVVQALDLRGIAASAGAACASGSVGPSPVLEAMGHPEPAGGIRFSFGWSTHLEEVEALCAILPEVVRMSRTFLAG